MSWHLPREFRCERDNIEQKTYATAENSVPLCKAEALAIRIYIASAHTLDCGASGKSKKILQNLGCLFGG